MNITTTDNCIISIPVENIKQIINESIFNSQESYRVPFTFEEICNFVSESTSSGIESSDNFKKILSYLKSLFTPPKSEVLSVDILGEEILESQTYKFCENIYSHTYTPLFNHNDYFLTNIEDSPGIYTQPNFVSRKVKQQFADDFDMKIILSEILDFVYLKYNIVLYGQGVEYLHNTEYYLPLDSVKFYIERSESESERNVTEIYEYLKNLKRFTHCNTYIYNISFEKSSDKIYIILFLSYTYRCRSPQTNFGHSIYVQKTTLHLEFDLKSYNGIEDLFKNMIDSDCIAWNGDKFYMNNRFVQSQINKSVILRNMACSESDIRELRRCIDFGYTVLIPDLDISKFLRNVNNPKFLLGFEEIAYNIMF